MQGNNIRITAAADGALRFSGNATYHGRGQFNLGSFNDLLYPDGALVDVSIGSDPCSITMGLFGGLLAVFDQGKSCDGLNVSFTGIYTRQKRPQ